MMGKSRSKKGSGGGAGTAVGVIVTLAILAIAAAAGWYFFLRSTPEKTVTQFLDALYDGKPDVAKACLTEESAKGWDRVGSQISQMYQKSQTGDKKEKPYKIGKCEARGTTATVQVSTPVPQEAAQYLGGKTSFDSPMVCVKEKGAWKIDGAETAKQMIQSLMGSVTMPGMPRMPGK